MNDKDAKQFNQNKIVVEYDILRVIVTLLVIIGHCTYFIIESQYGGCDYTSYTLPRASIVYKLTEYVTLIIYLFHMPLYIILSGALYRYKKSIGGGYNSYKSLIKDKAKKLLLPFIVVTLFYSVPLKYISGYYSNSNNVIKDIFWGQVLVQGNTHLWFLPVLFIIFVIMFFLEKQLKVIKDRLTICLFVLSLFSAVIPIGVLKSAVYYIFWFYMGYCFEQHRKDVNERLEEKRILPRFLFIAFICVGILKKVFQILLGNFYISMICERLLEYICAILGCLFVYSLSYILSKTQIIKRKLFKTIRTNSFGLYLYSDTWNYVILRIAVNMFGNVIFVTNVGAILFYFCRIIITLNIAIAVSMILKKLKIKYIC